MIQSVKMKNFGPLRDFEYNNFANINLIIGENGSGKTFLLKALYTAIKTLEMYRRGDDTKEISEILREKLRWTFQADEIGDLVTKRTGENNSLAFRMVSDEKLFYYTFGKDTKKNIKEIDNETDLREDNSIFLPAKEVLSLYNVILISRDTNQMFGFDDTYYDLARAIRPLPVKGKNYKSFSDARKALYNLVGGKVLFDDAMKKWRFRKEIFEAGKRKPLMFSIGVTAEGIKKISILDTLLSNRYLNKASIIFIDEPEAALHPEAISRYMEILFNLAQDGVQIFIASHSYFVIKKLYLLSKKNNRSIPTIGLSESSDQITFDDLLEGMPENSIVNESVRLYKEEMESLF
ncbi:MAG TPA: ATP-binding protein [Thermotogota bacterium]|nr:ATP-binding protein [Thermotogota bacterium]